MLQSGRTVWAYPPLLNRTNHVPYRTSFWYVPAVPCSTGGAARHGRAAANSAARHATAVAPEGPLAVLGRPLRPRGHATAVP
eukprot:294851-Chlamydomonas_euryale.AAC.1